MKIKFIDRLKAVLASWQKEHLYKRTFAELQAHRFMSNAELSALIGVANFNWLAFMAFQDQEGKIWFSVGQSSTVQDWDAETVKGTIIVVARELFDGQKQPLITELMRHIDLSTQLIRLDEPELKQWQWVFDKTECTLVSDYAFRRAYLQELVMQAVHFSLKQIALKKISLDTYHPIKVVIDNECLSDEYVSAFNKTLTISAN